MYSFAPTLRIFNGELQAVSGIGELATLLRDRGAKRLFARAEPSARRAILASDTGAWSLYSQSGRESTLNYHRLLGEFLGDMCERTRRPAYCDAHARFARYEREPTRIGVVPPRGLVARRAHTIRFAISKVSHVQRARVRPARARPQPRPRPRLRGPHGRLDAAGARALPAADHGAGPERAARLRRAALPHRAAEAEAEEAGEGAQGGGGSAAEAEQLVTD